MCHVVQWVAFASFFNLFFLVGSHMASIGVAFGFIFRLMVGIGEQPGNFILRCPGKTARDVLLGT